MAARLQAFVKAVVLQADARLVCVVVRRPCTAEHRRTRGKAAGHQAMANSRLLAAGVHRAMGIPRKGTVVTVDLLHQADRAAALLLLEDLGPVGLASMRSGLR